MTIDADGIDRADFRRDDQVDDAVGKHRRRERKADAERLPLDRVGGRRLAAAPPPPTFCTTGTGNSPPARKLAVSPDSAISVGCASVVTAPLRSSASSWTLKLRAERPERARDDPEAVGDRADAIAEHCSGSST